MLLNCRLFFENANGCITLKVTWLWNNTQWTHRGWLERKTNRPRQIRHSLRINSWMCQWNRFRPTWVWLVSVFPTLWQSQSEAALSWPQTEEILLVVTFTIQAASSASMLLYSLSPMFPHTFIPLYLSATQNLPLISTTWNFVIYFLVPCSSSYLSSSETLARSKKKRNCRNWSKCLNSLTRILESIQLTV